MELSDEIGGQLQRARERAGLALDDVVFQTRIPRTVIEALEAGDFSFFSSPTYAKSFLSQYSQFLEVEADPWLEALQPASFLAGDIGGHLLGGGVAKIDERESESKSGMSWLAPMSFLLVSAGLVLAAMKGYEFFEKRFGGELPVGSKDPEEAGKVVASPQTPNETPLQTAVFATKAQALELSRVHPTPPPAPSPTEEELPLPPPRAIIVR
jgi:cytoskeleton protein RodZ